MSDNEIKNVIVGHGQDSRFQVPMLQSEMSKKSRTQIPMPSTNQNKTFIVEPKK